MYKRYRGFKWYSKRDAAFTAAIVAVIVAVICIMSAFEASKGADKEFAPADDNRPVVVAEYGERGE